VLLMCVCLIMVVFRRVVFPLRSQTTRLYEREWDIQKHRATRDHDLTWKKRRN